MKNDEVKQEDSQVMFITEEEFNAVQKELQATKAELQIAKNKIEKQTEAINKLINAMANRYAQDLIKEVLPE